MCIRCRVKIWKCIYFCNLPKSVITPLRHSVPLEAKLSDRQWECSNSLYSAFHPIILFKNTDTKRGEKHVNHVLCLRLRFTRCDNVGLLFWKYKFTIITTRIYCYNNPNCSTTYCRQTVITTWVTVITTRVYRFNDMNPSFQRLELIVMTTWVYHFNKMNS